MNYLLKIVSIMSVYLVNESISSFHKGFKVCKIKGPNFGSCLDIAIENGIKYLKSGLQEYDIPSLDPFHIPTLTVGAGTGAVNLVQNYKDVVMTGFSDLKVNDSSVNFERKVLKFSTIHPLLEQKGNYDINGKILMLPVQGRGPCTISLENTYSQHEIEFEEVKTQDNIHFKPKSYFLKMHPNHVKYLLENLFDGNQLLGDNINRLINEEWLAVFRDVEEGYEKSYAKFFLNFAKNIFEKVPIKEIFLL